MDIRYSLTTLGLSAALFASQVSAAPVANPDVRTIPANVPVTVDVLSNDFDDEGFNISLVPDSVTQPEFGEVTVSSDGGIRYIPAPDYVGQDQFTYTIINDAEEPGTAVGTVTINVVPATMSGQPGLTSNYASVAQTIDAVCSQLQGEGISDAGTGTQQLADRCEALMALSDEERQRAVQQIAPDETLALSRVGANASEFQSQAVGGRLAQLGRGISTISTRGLTWSHDNLAGGAAGDDSSILARVGVFASVQLEDASKDRSEEEAGFGYKANSIIAGADYAVNSDWQVGGAFGWTNNDLTFRDEGGKVKADIYTFIAYSNYGHNNLNFSGQLGYGVSNIDISRRIVYGSGENMFDATTSGSTSGNQWFLTTEAQYLWSHNALTLYPNASLNYLHSYVGRYADNDAGGWEVELGKQEVDKFYLQSGVQGSYVINTNWGVFIPNFEANLIADINTDQNLVTGSFAFAPDSEQDLSFAMEAEEPEAFYYQLGTGFSVILPHGWSGFFGVRTTLGYTDFSATQYQAGFRKEL